MKTATKIDWVSRIDSVLDTRGQTRSWLARQLNMHKSQLSRLMNPAENRYLLRPYHKARIAEIFDVPESFIFGDNGQERS